MPSVACKQCNKEFSVVPARLPTARFCSYRCRADWQRDNGVFRRENNPNFRGGQEKACAHCGTKFYVQPALAHRQFCSKPCADIGGFRYTGKEHPNYREDARRRNRCNEHAKWREAVLARDGGVCQHCGTSGVELHAHHLKSHKDHPDLRFVLSNGITLCYRCHWAVHTASNANPVNSVNTRTDNAEGNTEPSSHRKVLEGVTTRGRAYRRWFGNCEFCAKLISRAPSDMVGKAHFFCSKSCSAKFRVAKASKLEPTAVIASTSAGRESDEIVCSCK